MTACSPIIRSSDFEVSSDDESLFEIINHPEHINTSPHSDEEEPYSRSSTPIIFAENEARAAIAAAERRREVQEKTEEDLERIVHLYSNNDETSTQSHFESDNDFEDSRSYGRSDGEMELESSIEQRGNGMELNLIIFSASQVEENGDLKADEVDSLKGQLEGEDNKQSEGTNEGTNELESDEVSKKKFDTPQQMAEEQLELQKMLIMTTILNMTFHIVSKSDESNKDVYNCILKLCFLALSVISLWLAQILEIRRLNFYLLSAFMVLHICDFFTTYNHFILVLKLFTVTLFMLRIRSDAMRDAVDKAMAAFVAGEKRAEEEPSQAPETLHFEFTSGRLGAVYNACASGALIVKVRPNSEAERQGLRAGDVIQKVNGADLRGLPYYLVSNMFYRAKGVTSIEVIRTMAEVPIEENLSFELARDAKGGLGLSYKKINEVIIINHVTPNGEADRKGLKVGDKIEGINGFNMELDTLNLIGTLFKNIKGTVTVEVKRKVTSK